MPILVENVLEKSQLGKLDSSSVKKLNEAIEQEVSTHKKQIEKETSAKFERMVESITVKFSSQVDKAIMESVTGRVGVEINEKLVEVITGVVNILESAGIYNTEKTKVLTNQLREANKNLEDAYSERETVRELLDEEKKVNYILQRLTGTKPEIVNAALDYFKDKDMIDVQDEIDAFVEGDFKNLLHNDSDTFTDGLSEITLDQVDDALRDISSEKTDRGMQAKFEAIGKGLKPQTGTGRNRTPTINLNAVVESAEEGGYSEDDTGLAMNQIRNFRDLGYNFR